MNLRVVTREGEKEFSFEELELPFEATDTEILSRVERKLDANLDGYIVTRRAENVLVSPTPVFG